MYIIFDIGGTKMRLAATRDLKAYHEVRIAPTPAEFDAAMAQFEAVARELAQGEPIEGIAGGVPSPLDHDRNVLLSPTNLIQWKGRALRDELKNKFNCPVFVENDAAIVALGEAAHGAGKGFSIVAYLTVSTGVGGARIVDGKIDEHASGFEPGRMIIDESHAPGDLESLVSGRALEQRIGKKPADVHDEAVWDELARHLAVGIYNIIAEWSPNAIVLGGSMIVRPVGIKVATVKKHLQTYASRIAEMPDIREATLADEGGLHGALAYLAQNIRA